MAGQLLLWRCVPGAPAACLFRSPAEQTLFLSSCADIDETGAPQPGVMTESISLMSSGTFALLANERTVNVLRTFTFRGFNDWVGTVQVGHTFHRLSGRVAGFLQRHFDTGC